MNKEISFKIDKDKFIDQVISKKISAQNSSPVQDLIKFIYALSEKDVTEFNTDIEKENALNQLKSIYIDDFRHLYSEIFRCMISLDKSIAEGSSLYNLNTNMRVCYEYIKSLDKTVADEEFKKKVFKLYDHIALEYARIAYWVSHKEEINRQLTDAQDSIIDVSKQSKELLDNVNSAKKEAENLKSSQVTVLGIFISILVGLLGQVYVVGKSLSSITNGENLGPLLILIIVASVCTISAIVALLHIVAKIIDKNILSKCSQSDTCDTCERDNNKCHIIKRLKYRLPYLYGFYQLSLVLLYLVWVFFYIPLNSICDYILFVVAIISVIIYICNIWDYILFVVAIIGAIIHIYNIVS